mmetsp:Transcript_37408/g.76777  ORF Transcript_37408/g.76777 Transcript_37408/m.76777 type:complete len:213 (+) Transcript_37408:858-1496(+)
MPPKCPSGTNSDVRAAALRAIITVLVCAAAFCQIWGLVSLSSFNAIDSLHSPASDSSCRSSMRSVAKRARGRNKGTNTMPNQPPNSSCNASSSALDTACTTSACTEFMTASFAAASTSMTSPSIFIRSSVLPPPPIFAAPDDGAAALSAVSGLGNILEMLQLTTNHTATFLKKFLRADTNNDSTVLNEWTGSCASPAPSPAGFSQELSPASL